MVKLWFWEPVSIVRFNHFRPNLPQGTCRNHKYLQLTHCGSIMTTKKCNSCLVCKPVTDFYTNGRTPKGVQKYKPTCKPCELINKKATARKTIEEYFGGWKCSDCGFEGKPIQYDLHHLDPKQKEYNVAQIYKKATNSPETFLREIKKCVMLCANCHRMRHGD